MGIEFFKNWGTCIKLRGLMDGDTGTAWKRRITDANPDKLRRIAAELMELTGYSGKMRYKPGLTRAGQRQAGIFLEETLGQVFEKDFVLLWGEFKFPYANDQSAAQRVVSLVGVEINALYRENPRVVLNERRDVLHVVLRNRFDYEVRKIYEGKGLEGQVRRLFEDKIRVLPIGIQNIFLLKLLEMIEVERGPVDSWEEAFEERHVLEERQRITRSRLEEMVWSVLNCLPAERLAGLSPERAKAAMFFLFRFGENELKASQSSYVLYFIANHPNPDELIREYLSLDAKGTHNTFALRDLTPKDTPWLRSPDSRGWVYDDRLVTAAIEAGQVRNFGDVIRLGRAGRFFNRENGPRPVRCYRPPE